MGKNTSRKAFVAVLVLNVIACLAGPIAHIITGQSQPVVHVIGFAIGIAVTVFAVIMNQKEKKAAAAARRQRIYA